MTPAVAAAARGTPTIAVNDTFRLAPWADVLYAADAAWWERNPDAAGFAGLRVTLASVLGCRSLINSGTMGFDPDPRNVRTGGNSGYQAIHVAAHAGAKRILLCGFDMTGRRGSHWFGDHQGPLRNTEEGTYARWLTRYELLKVELDNRRIEVINCTPRSALRCFPFGELESELARPRLAA
jgi:hypothetical protein